MFSRSDLKICSDAVSEQRYCILKKKGSQKLQQLGFVELPAVRYSDFGPLSLLPNTHRPIHLQGWRKNGFFHIQKPAAHAALQSPHCTRTLKANACKATRCKHTSICTRIKNIQCSSVPRKKTTSSTKTTSRHSYCLFF